MNSVTLSTQAFYVFFSKLCALLISISVPILLVRLLSKAEYGHYLQVILIIASVVEIFKWGIINSLYFFISSSEDDKEGLFSQSFFLLFLLGLISSILIFCFKSQLSNFLRIEDISKIIWALMIYVNLMLTSLILDHIFVLEKKLITVLKFELIDKLIRSFLILYAVITFEEVAYIFYCLTIHALLRFVYLFFYLRSNYRISLTKIKKKLLIKQIRYSFPIGAARFIGEIGKKADKFILIYFISPALYSIYSVAFFGIPIITLLFSSVSQVVIPKMSMDHKLKNQEEIKELWHKTIKSFALLIIPVIFLFELISEDLIILMFTIEYIDAVIIYQIFLLGILLNILAPSILLRSIDKTKSIFYSHFYSAIAAVVFGYILIQNFGMIGGAVSFILSSLVRSTSQIISIKKNLNINFKTLLPWRYLLKIIILSIVSAFLIFIIPLPHDNLVFSIAFILISYIITITFFLYVFKIINRKDIDKMYSSIISVYGNKN